MAATGGAGLGRGTRVLRACGKEAGGGGAKGVGGGEGGRGGRRALILFLQVVYEDQERRRGQVSMN
jgi:hypothetical protein